MKASLLSLLLLFFNTINIHAQEISGTSQQPQFSNFNTSPVSPEATAMGKYGDIPVGLYTGVPNISIPLGELSSREITVPVSLSYHSSGLKVEEVATNVGLGWSLSAGGTITRVIRGLPDLEASPGYGYAANSDKIAYILNRNNIDSENSNIDFESRLYYYFKDVTSGLQDSEPDIYYFNFLGRSGKFVFDQNGNIHTVPFQKLKITYDHSNEDIIIRDENGWDYIFKVKETTTTNTFCPDKMPQKEKGNLANGISWKLVQITTPKGDWVKFIYKPVALNYKTIDTEYESVLLDYQYYCDELLPKYYACENDVTTLSAALDSIVTASGDYFVFQYEGDRKDLPVGSGKRISKITLNSKKSFKEFDLYHSYFESPNYSEIVDSKYRLRLDSVKEKGIPSHIFKYNESVSLPNRLSKAQDFWGYYNGAERNTLLPKALLGNKYVDGADRNISPVHAAAGILTMITYPTGGSTAFFYEPNDYYYEGVESIIADSSAGVGARVDTMTTKTFKITPNSSAIKLRYGNNGGTTVTGHVSMHISGKLTDSEGNPIEGEDFSMPLSGKSEPGGTALALSPGIYTLRIGFAPSDTINAFIHVSWQEVHRSEVKKSVIVGGLRIARMVDDSHIPNEKPKIKRYVY
jgi:hypothetical protein